MPSVALRDVKWGRWWLWHRSGVTKSSHVLHAARRLVYRKMPHNCLWPSISGGYYQNLCNIFRTARNR
jgi:hypothetical protein